MLLPIMLFLVTKEEATSEFNAIIFLLSFMVSPGEAGEVSMSPGELAL